MCRTSAGSLPVNETTFDRCFCNCDWAVMFVLAKDDSTYARLRWRHPAPAELEIASAVDFLQPFEGSDQEQWRLEYAHCVIDHSWGPLPTRIWDDFDLFEDWSLPEQARELVMPASEVSP